MMSRTHLAVGVATALAFGSPHNLETCLISTIGGLIGGITPDIDILDNDYTGDALLGQVLALGITGLILLIDFIFKIGICASLFSRNIIFLILGIVLAIILYFVGLAQNHRGFTHSFLALIIYTIPIALIFPPLIKPFMLGFLSHIIIDLFNKRKVKIFFPSKHGICFNLCYANKTGNKALMYIGILISISLFILGLF